MKSLKGLLQGCRVSSDKSRRNVFLSANIFYFSSFPYTAWTGRSHIDLSVCARTLCDILQVVLAATAWLVECCRRVLRMARRVVGSTVCRRRVEPPPGAFRSARAHVTGTCPCLVQQPSPRAAVGRIEGRVPCREYVTRRCVRVRVGIRA